MSNFYTIVYIFSLQNNNRLSDHCLENSFNYILIALKLAGVLFFPLLGR